MNLLISRAHRNEVSLAAFRPSRVRRFIHEKTDREWDPSKLAELEKNRAQADLFFDQETIANQFEVVKKLPYKFSYKIEDAKGKSSTMMIEDWELGALYWNCLRSTSGDETKALAKVKQRYWDDFVVSGNTELTLILGTTLTFHQMKTPNPFIIVGILYPKFDPQASLF
ncbi:MAG: hypothetical protein GC168_15100 [Candidatus Hydrogenedens sp.]|nr:hypothetical protein [Candidatus Hydrogenedens sp.]